MQDKENTQYYKTYVTKIIFMNFERRSYCNSPLEFFISDILYEAK